MSRVTITVKAALAAAPERCYDHGLIAMALSDPAIQRLLVTRLVEAVSTEGVGDLIYAVQHAMDARKRDYITPVKAAFIAALCGPTGDTE